MPRRVLLIAIAAIAAALVPATAGADGGNISVGSIGTVQVSSTGSAPQATATTPGGTTSVTAPVQVPGTGNVADSSQGSVQVGGSNTSKNSAATVQTSSVHGAPSASVNGKVVRAKATAPATIPGNAPNAASGSTGSVQVGGGHSSRDSFLTIGVNRPSASPAASATYVGGRPTIALNTPAPLKLGGASLSLARPSISHGGSVTLKRQYALDLQQLVLQAQWLGVQPAFFLAADPIAKLTLGGWTGASPNGGNTASGSPGTVQTGQIGVSPTVGVRSKSLGSSVAVGGTNSLGGAGTNSVSKSIGNAQVGGGNSADPSLGTVQIGGFTLAPTFRANSPDGSLAANGGSGIAGGGNLARNSNGTVQIGGGNNASNSTGVVQSGGLTVNPAVSANGTPAGSASAGGGTSVAGRGNSARSSLGAVQVGGGNVVRNSNGAAQSGGPTVGPTASVAGTPAGGASAGGTTNVAGTGNTAAGSTGVGQVGGGNLVNGSNAVVQAGGITVSPTTSGGGLTAGLPTNIGSGSGNTATGSTGVGQVGGGNTATGGTGVVQVGGPPAGSSTPAGPTAQTLSSGPPTPIAGAGGTPSSSGGSGPGATGAGPGVSPSHVRGAQHNTGSTPSSSPVSSSHRQLSLPFTGLDLLAFVLAALALAACGMGARRLAL
jgi:hypothetical protein